MLSEHAFKRLGLGAGSDDEDEDGYGSDLEGPAAVEGDKDDLAISRPELPAQLVATLEKRGITHLFPIQGFVFDGSLELQLRLPRSLAFVLPWRVIQCEQEGAEESNARFAWASLVLRGRSAYHLRKELANRLGVAMDVSNLVMCVRAGRGGRTGAGPPPGGHRTRGCR
ncbi:DEAD-box ATP-dependent RNA helicase 3-like [Hordeum vulgare subsp. vulgare]|uniref:DEAD-box ATP-dependent RNA helicase 3-like n=1 Tax=Hordeum vulgare subsp. vulgare TaxID=112509 RepID=UPI001D1A437E|nr:DEAD-box ATP-dependent RNA helicase 3-like [Hordeum vulgare subsp. vulgare]